MTSAAPPPDVPDGFDPIEVKDRLRVAARARRARMTDRARADAELRLAQVVGDLAEVRAARTVAAYVAREHEPGTSALLERLTVRGTTVLLPALGTGLSRDWAWFTGSSRFVVRAPGRPPEPDGPTLGAQALALADVIIVPALAVDTSGTRLGQGGAWYDRVLEHARPGAPVVAMVFADEVLDAEKDPLPCERHDRRVDVVATPGGARRLSRPSGAG